MKSAMKKKQPMIQMINQLRIRKKQRMTRKKKMMKNEMKKLTLKPMAKSILF